MILQIEQSKSNLFVNKHSFQSVSILNLFRYWMDRGNFVQALRYMNLLQGASRKVSSQWMEEVKLLLETQQAVNLLMGHASANSNRYL